MVQNSKFLFAITVIAFAVYVYYSESKNIYDKLTFRKLNMLIKQQEKVISELQEKISTLEAEKEELKTTEVLDCAKTLDLTKTYKKAKPVETKPLPKIGTVHIDDESKIEISPVITPEEELGGAKIILEKKF